MSSQRNGYWMPSPRIPDCIKAKHSISGLSLQPFGLFDNDLEIDFNQQLPPHLVTQVLKCCTRDITGETPDQAFFWDLTISKRIECLLAIATLGGSSELSIHLRCSNETCQEPMEIEISLEEVADQHRTDATDPIIPIGDDTFMIRKPTGNDQLEWLKSSFPNEDAAIKAMIRTLLHDNDKAGSGQQIPISDDLVKTINEAMEEFDPLVNFSLRVYCPHCNREDHYTINLEDLCLNELYKSQLNLLQTIHCLAAHYHWSEQQILSIRPWRRSHYLALIEKEETK